MTRSPTESFTSKSQNLIIIKMSKFKSEISITEKNP